MDNLLWRPSKELRENSLLREFTKFVELKPTNNFKDVWEWSIKNPKIFWSKFWDYSGIIGDKGKKVISKDKIFNKTKFFSESKLNYCENIIKKKSDLRAIEFLSESGYE